MQVSLTTLIVCLSFISICLSAGMSTHSFVADRALDWYDPINFPTYRSMLQNSRSYYQPGSFFPDFGYSCRGFSTESESSHWPSFINSTAHLWREKYPRPWSRQVEGTFSFLFGIMAHSVADNSWHSLNMYEGLIEMMRYVEFKGSFNDAHTAADIGGEFVLKSLIGLNGHSELIWNVPSADLVEAFELYYGGETKVREEDIDFCINLGYAGVWANQILGDLAFPYLQKSPALLEEYEDYFLGGLHDMSAWTAKCWEDLAKWIEVGGPERPMCTLMENQWDRQYLINENKISKIQSAQESLEKLYSFGYSINQTKKNGITSLQLVRRDGKDPLEYHQEMMKKLSSKIEEDLVDSCVPETEFYNSSTSTFVTSTSYSHFGQSLATGDFNNDGLDDLAVGEPLSGKMRLHQAGLVHIVNGRTSRYNSQNLISQIASTTLYNDAAFSRFGKALTVVDMNRDGIDDLAVSAPFYNGLKMYYDGQVYVYFGSNKGLSTSPDITIKVDQKFPDGFATHPFKFTLMGLNLESNDIDGDGFKDLIIGSPLAAAKGEGHQSGLVSIFFSSSRHIGVRDIYADVDRELLTYIDYERFGSDILVTEVSGQKMLLVSSHTHKIDNNNQEAGKIYGYKINDLKTPLFTITGNKEFLRFGSKVISGDFFLDGRNLIAISAPSERHTLDWHAGSVYIIDIAGLKGDLSLSDVKVVTTIQGGEKGGQFGSEMVVVGNSLFIAEPAFGNVRSDLKANTGRIYEWKMGPNFPTRVVRDRVSSSNRCIYGIETRAKYGQTMSQGDFDGDGRIDFVVSSTHSSSGAASAGRVNLYYL